MELTVVMLIIGLAASVAAPSMIRSVQSRRLTVHAGDLADFLKKIHYQAILESRAVGVVADRNKATIEAPRLGLSWSIPEGYQIEFEDKSLADEEQRRWLLFHPNGAGQGGTALFCRQQGDCYEVGADPRGSIVLARSELRAVR